ncbi:hypothetical protein BHE74_00035934 [Ensete ventricosum]|nr:hypothetical protein BHE74_00035934 [Ensete ventricosum]
MFEISSLAPERCASSSRCWLGGWEPKQSPYARFDFWSLVELQSLEVCCDVLGGVAYPWLWDLIRLATEGRPSLFYSVFFRSSTGSLVVDTCTKAIVGGGEGDVAAPIRPEGDVATRYDPSDGQVSNESFFVIYPFLYQRRIPNVFVWAPFILHGEVRIKSSGIGPVKGLKALEVGRVYARATLVGRVHARATLVKGDKSSVKGLKALKVNRVRAQATLVTGTESS